MTLGELIKHHRKEKGLTQKELGELLGVSPQMVAQYERNVRNPKKETLQRIAKALNVSPAEFFEDSSLITAKDERDIKKDLDSIMDKISTKTDEPASYGGEELSPESLELFRGELEIVLKRLKLINKEKYNPHKDADRPPSEPPANEGQPPAGADPHQDNNQDNE